MGNIERSALAIANQHRADMDLPPLDDLEATADPALFRRLAEAALNAAHEGAVALLRELIDVQDETCHYDHHGYCQAHWLHEKPCPVERARTYLGRQ